MKSLLLTALCVASIASLRAGNINIISCVPEKSVEVTLSLGDVSQSFRLECGQSSGRFVLEEKSVTIRASIWGDDTSTKEFKGEAGLLLIYNSAEGLAVKLVESEPTQETFSLRVLNLDAKTVDFVSSGVAVSLAPGKPMALECGEHPTFRLDFEGQEKADRFEVEEPAAVLAIVIGDGGKWHVLWVVDA